MPNSKSTMDESKAAPADKFQIATPAITLPKGGGVIRGMGCSRESSPGRIRSSLETSFSDQSPKRNITAWYGRKQHSRISDPNDKRQIFTSTYQMQGSHLTLSTSTCKHGVSLSGANGMIARRRHHETE